MSEKIQARDLTDPAADDEALVAVNGQVQRDGYASPNVYDPDEVAAVVAEAKRQQEEIERKKRTMTFTVDGVLFEVTLQATGGVKVRSHNGEALWAERAAEQAVYVYRILQEINGET